MQRLHWWKWTLKVQVSAALAWIAIAFSVYGFVLFMLPAIYRLGISAVLLVGGGGYLFLRREWVRRRAISIARNQDKEENIS